MKVISDYIEQLCRDHPDVRHTDSECHYVNLQDEHQTMQANQLNYPAIFFETTGYRVNPHDDMLSKRYECHLQVEQHVTDTGDYAEVERAIAKSDAILTDIFITMWNDRRRRNPRWLYGMSFENIDVVSVENRGNALYGVLARFYISIPVCTIPKNT